MRRAATRYATVFRETLSELSSGAELEQRCPFSAAKAGVRCVSRGRWLSTGVAPQWVFLGPPGVGKGTYSKRIAKHLQVPHISTGDLVRAEISLNTPLGKQIQGIHRGHLLPDSLVLKVCKHEPERNGFVLDGFPRTLSQAEKLSEHTDIHLVCNLAMREEVLVEKCLGRRLCGKCGKEYNVADIYLKAENGKKEIILPPMPPPPDCLKHMTMRDDDRQDIIKKRLQVHKAEAKPVEDFYRDRGVLLDFEVTGGIPETLPVLLRALEKYIPAEFSEEGRKMVA